MKKLAKLSFSDSMLHQIDGVPTELMKQILEAMPIGTTFVGASADHVRAVSSLIFTSDTFPEIQLGQEIPEILSVFTRFPDGTTELRGLEFPWQAQRVSFPSAAKEACDHNWELYTGLQDSYDICTKCGLARP